MIYRTLYPCIRRYQQCLHQRCLSGKASTALPAQRAASVLKSATSSGLSFSLLRFIYFIIDLLLWQQESMLGREVGVVYPWMVQYKRHGRQESVVFVIQHSSACPFHPHRRQSSTYHIEQVFFRGQSVNHEVFTTLRDIYKYLVTET